MDLAAYSYERQGMEPEELITVAEDLHYLKTGWVRNISDAEIRRGSAILRRLLVEKRMGQAWREVGFEREPIILGGNLEAQLSGVDRSSIMVALAGGAEVQDWNGSALLFVKLKPYENKPPERNFSPEEMEAIMAHPFSLSQYVESECAVVQGQSIKRRELIKYMANVRGGVHLGKEITGQKMEDSLIRRIRLLEGGVDAFQKSGLTFELLAIGQSVGKSPDTQKLIDKIREVYRPNISLLPIR